MDLSKIPGKTPGDAKPPQPIGRVDPLTEQSPSSHPPSDIRDGGASPPHPTSPPNPDLWLSGPETWLHVGIGLLVCWFAQNPFRAALSPLGLLQPPPNAIFQGAAIPYLQSWFFIHDLPSAMLGTGLLLEALALGLLRSKPLAFATAGWLLVTTLTAVGALIYLQPKMGFQLMPAIALFVAGYIAWTLVAKLKT
jgi:hypothetical protein